MTSGSQWHEAVIRAGKLGNGGPRHGSPERWDWSVTLWSLDQALQRHQRHEQLRAQLTPEQRAQVLTSETRRAAER